MGLRFLLLVVETTGFFFFVAVAVALFGVFFAGVFCAVVLLAGELLVAVLSGAVGVGDWATAGGNKPSQGKTKIPAKTATAKRRTQTLPTDESWHP